MDKDIFIMLKNYYNKNNKLPPDNRMLVIKNFIKKGDLLDYVLETKNKKVKVTYTYYENSKDEKKFIHSTLLLNRVS